MADAGLLSDADVGLGSAPAASQSGLLSDSDVGLAPAPDKGGPLANSADDGLLSGAAKGAGTAVIKGLSNSAGFAGNLMNLGDYLMARGESAVTGKPLDEVYKSQQDRRAAVDASRPSWMTAIDPRNVMPNGQQIAAPILAKTGEYVPQSEIGKMGMAGLETAAGMVGPGAGAKAPGASLAQAALATPLKMAPANLAAGAAGQGVSDFTGDPLLGSAVGLGAAGALSGAGAAASKIAKPFVEDLPVIGNRFAGTREQMAGDLLKKSASDPAALDRALNPGPLQPGQEPNYEILPGSRPSLGQLTGDMGIMQAERQAKTVDNSGFNLNEGKQNEARVSALRDAAPPNADSMAPSQLFQSQLDHIDRSSQAAVDHLTNNAQSLAAQLGPGVSPEDAGAAIRNGIEAVRADQRAARSAAYRAVDPDEKLNIVAQPLADAATGLRKSIGQYEVQPTGEEAAILSEAANMPSVVKFKDLTDFDSRITAAMAQERRTAGETPVLRRLSQLKSAVADTINNAVENQANFDRAAVQRGDMAPGTDLESRMRALWGLDGSNSGRNAGGYRAGDFGAATEPAFISTGAGRADVPSGGGFGGAQSGSGVSSPSLEPNFDPDAAARLAVAKNAHANYAQTYRQGPVAPVLKTTGFAGQYRLPDSAVPSRAFVKGDAGYQAVKAFAKAANNNPDALSAIQDYALSPLRKGLTADGTIPPQKFAAWQKDYGPALRAIDEIAPGFSTQYKNAADATDAMIKAGAVRKKMLDLYQKTQAADFLGKTNPVEVENQIGTMLRAKQNGPTRMRELVKQASANPAAVEGLRRAAVDWMVREFSNAAEAAGSTEKTISSARFQKFVRDNRATLKEIFPENQVNIFGAIADDLKRADRVENATRVKASPGSAKDILPHLQKGLDKAAEHVSFLGAVQGGALAGWMHGESMKSAAMGALGAGAAYHLGKLRSAGLDNVQSMFRDALENPHRARYYLSKATPENGDNAALRALAASLSRQLVAQPVFEQNLEKQQRASGGRVA